MTRDDQRHFAGGAVRDATAGKGRFDLLPPRAIRAVAQRFEEGATRYPDRNWEQGEPIGGSFMDSGLRHALRRCGDSGTRTISRRQLGTCSRRSRRASASVRGSCRRRLDDIGVS